MNGESDKSSKCRDENKYRVNRRLFVTHRSMVLVELGNTMGRSSVNIGLQRSARMKVLMPEKANKCTCPKFNSAFLFLGSHPLGH